MRNRLGVVILGAFGLGLLGPWLAADANSVNGRYNASSEVSLINRGTARTEDLEGRLRVRGDNLKGKLNEVGGNCKHKYDLLFQKAFKSGRKVKSESIGEITRKCGGDKRTYFLYTGNGSCKAKSTRRGNQTLRCKLLTIQIDGDDIGSDRTEKIRGSS
ncbi:MAG: hypothetical protein AAFY08_07885 [Planctomycetota bacterium]